MKKAVVAVMTVVLISGGIGAGLALPYGDTVVKGISVEGKNLTGLKEAQVRDTLRQVIAARGQTFKLVGPNRVETVRLADLGIVPDLEKTVEAVMAKGHEAALWERLHSRVALHLTPVDIPIYYKLDEPRADAFFTAYAKKLPSEGRDAYLAVEQGKVVLHPEVKGAAFDKKATLQALKEYLKGPLTEPFKPVISEKAPGKVTAQMLKEMTEVLGQYTTAFNPGAVSRSHNIQLSSDKVNGTILQPGEIFSFNEVVGERTAEAGYDDAPVFIGGKLVPGIGGGICQESSTLFNAALLGGMEIVERDSHFAPVSYLPAGRDATVAYGYIDFKFKNTHAHPVYLVSEINGGMLSVYIVGHPEDKPRSVSVYATGEQVIGNKTVTKVNMAQKETVVEEEGHAGLQVTVVRAMVDANGMQHTQTYPSYYEPVDRVVVEGSEAVQQREKAKVKAAKEKADKEKAGKGKVSPAKGASDSEKVKDKTAANDNKEKR